MRRSRGALVRRFVIARLADVLFIQIVRGHLASLPVDGSGWLGALADAQIGAALGHIHQSPEQDWTVQSLASKVAMSRSAFASRFMRLVGEPPLSYVTRWRMQKAASMLRDGKQTLAQVAAQVGYDSEAAFSKAFKRAVGSAPGAYRRSLRVPTLVEAAAGVSDWPDRSPVAHLGEGLVDEGGARARVALELRDQRSGGAAVNGPCHDAHVVRRHEGPTVQDGVRLGCAEQPE